MMRGSWLAASLMATGRSSRQVTREIPTEEPARQGLTKTGEAEALDAVHARGGVALPLTGGDANPAANVDTGGGEHRLGQVLVHGNRRGGHAASDVAHVGHLEEALDRAVLTVGAVQEREDDIDVAEVFDAHDAGVLIRGVAVVGEFDEVALARREGHAGRTRCHSLSLAVLECPRRRVVGDAHPLAVPRDTQRDHVPLGAVDGREDAGSRGARDFVFGGASTENDEDARTSWCSHGSKPTARQAFPARVCTF